MAVTDDAFHGRVGDTLADSEPYWPPRPAAPDGAPNVVFVVLDSFDKRVKTGLSKDAILADLRKTMGGIRDAFAFVLEPPSVPGIGTGGGLKGFEGVE